MANVNQEDLFLRFIPDVLIEKITLENSGFFPAEINPHIDNERERNVSVSASDAMRITINLLLKEKFDDDVIGKWISNIDFKKYIKIKVFQVTNPKIASLLSVSKDFITLLDPQLQSQMKPAVKKIAYSYLGATNDYMLKTILIRDVKRQQLDLLDPVSDSNVFKNGDIKREVNDDGSENYNVYYKINFDLKTSAPEHLSYFFMSVFDIEKISQDYNLKYPLLSALETTRVSSELVIQQGIPSTETYAYLLQNGEIWNGEVHQNRDGSFKTGAEETEDSEVLARVQVPNSKLQDFRNVKEINKLQFDFTKVNTYFSKLKNVNSSPPKPRDTKNLFGDIQLTRDIDRNANFVFDINFKDLVISNSMFSEMIKSYDSRISDEIMEKARIKYLRVFRRRVKETFAQTNRMTDQIGYEPFEKNSVEETVISLSQIDGSDSLAEVSQEDVYLRENKGIAFPDIRTIECTDRSMTYVTDGTYQYGVEIEVSDPTYPFLVEKLSVLRRVRRQAEEYLTEASTTSISKFFLEVADPHIKSRSERDLISTELEGNYDILTNSFTETFRKNMRQRYRSARLSPWVLVPTVYADVLELFIDDLDSVYLAKELMKMMSPYSGNPSGIIATIKLLDTLINTLSSVIGIVENTNSLGKRTSPRVTKTFKLKHYFANDVFDSDYDNIIAYEFFDESIVPEARRREITINKKEKKKKRKVKTPTINARAGFLKISGDAFQRMADKETLKFFNSANPDIKNPRNVPVKDSIQTTKYTFFTPNKISTLTKDYSLSNPKNKNNIALEKDLCDKDSDTKKDIMINNIRNIGITKRNTTETIVVTENFEELGDNLRALTKAIGSAASVIIELTTIDKEDLPEPKLPPKPNRELIGTRLGDRLANRIGRVRRPPRSNILDSIKDNVLNSGFSSFIDVIGKDIDMNTRGNTIRNKGIKPAISKDRIRTTTATTRIAPQKIAANINNFVSDKELLKLPNQLKATLLNNVGKNSVKTASMTPSKASTAQTESRFQVQFNSIKQIQILSGYEKGENGKLLVNRPIWETINQKKYENLPNNREIVGRFVDFDNKALCTPKPTSIKDINVLNDKFIIRPGTPVRIPPKKDDYSIKLPTGSINVPKGILDTIAKDSVKQAAIPAKNTKTNIVPSKAIEPTLNNPIVKEAITKIDTDRLTQNLANLTTTTVKPSIPKTTVTTQVTKASTTKTTTTKTTTKTRKTSTTKKIRR